MKRRRLPNPIDALRSIGLLIPQEQEPAVREALGRVSLYRLLPYAEYLLHAGGDRRSATWDELMSLYEQDRTLRLIFFDAIERIEVALRAQIDAYLRPHYGAEYLERGELFMGDGDHRTRKEIQRIRPLPALEGAYISHLYHICRTLTNPTDSMHIAMQFGLPKEVFVSWLQALAYARNLVAHHARLIGTQIPTSPKRLMYSRRLLWRAEEEQVPRDSILYVAHIMDYLLQTADPTADLLGRVRHLIPQD